MKKGVDKRDEMGSEKQENRQEKNNPPALPKHVTHTHRGDNNKSGHNNVESLCELCV